MNYFQRKYAKKLLLKEIRVSTSLAISEISKTGLGLGNPISLQIFHDAILLWRKAAYESLWQMNRELKVSSSEIDRLVNKVIYKHMEEFEHGEILIPPSLRRR